MKNNRLNFKFAILVLGFKYFYRNAIFILYQTYKQSISKEEFGEKVLKEKIERVYLNVTYPLPLPKKTPLP